MPSSAARVTMFLIFSRNPAPEAHYVLMKHEFELPARLRNPGCLPWLALVGWCVFVDCLRAQDHTVVFNTGAAGVSRAITNWGMSVTWPSPDNMRRTLIF